MTGACIITPQTYRNAVANLENHGVTEGENGFVQVLAQRVPNQSSLGILVMWDQSSSCIIIERYSDLPAAMKVFRAVRDASTDAEIEAAIASEPTTHPKEVVTCGLPEILKQR